MNQGVTIQVPAGGLQVHTPHPPASVCLAKIPALRGRERPAQASRDTSEVCLAIGVQPQAFSGIVGESSRKLYELQLVAMDRTIQSLRTEIDTQRNQITELRRQSKLLFDWHDTVNSPWYRRVVWWFQGFRVSALGTWYNARWNRAAGNKYNHLRTPRKQS